MRDDSKKSLTSGERGETAITSDQRPKPHLIIRDGYAHAYRRFPFSKRTEFIRLEEQARRRRIGLWNRRLNRGFAHSATCCTLHDSGGSVFTPSRCAPLIEHCRARLNGDMPSGVGPTRFRAVRRTGLGCAMSSRVPSPVPVWAARPLVKPSDPCGAPGGLLR